VTATSTREHIVRAADRLFYQHGYVHTSFTDIAGAVGLSRGNFYYHFKSKDSILEAVIRARLDERRGWLARWEAEEPDPLGRIERYLEIVLTNRSDIQDYGCPLGTLTAELAKLDHVMLDQAGDLHTLFREWIGEQFRLLGHGERSDELAMRVLTFSQGVGVMANVYRDEDYIRREVDQMRRWLRALTPTE
jgi:AcrR family transcriptional regulator